MVEKGDLLLIVGCLLIHIEKMIQAKKYNLVTMQFNEIYRTFIYS